MNKKATIWVLVIIIVAILAAWIWSAYQPASGSPAMQPPAATGTNPAASGTSSPAFDKSISDGTISLQYPGSDFGLATNGQQILFNAVIPACDSDFDYCLYFNNTSTYAGTNFESAGLRIEKRPDLTDQSKCLDINPSGYTGLSPEITTSTNYAISLFPNIGDGAAGNIAVDNIYRLAHNGVCYEFDVRIAQTQFANYPSGTINQFTATDQAALQAELNNVLNTLMLPSGQAVAFPQS